jgi:membrane protease YdiL (CAAX protease family)
MANGSLHRFIKENALIVFFVLAYALSWWGAILPAFGFPPMPIFPAGPFLAAVIILALTLGKSGVKDLLRRMVQWRIAPRWWAVALLLPVAAASTATLLNVLLGAEAPSAAELNGWPNLLPTFLLFLVLPISGAWEEPGWRGYALPGLTATRSPLAASLILGVLHAGWHLPLFLGGQIEWPDIPLIIAVSVVFAGLYGPVRGSVLFFMALHAMNNAVSGEFFSPMFAGDDSVRQAWMLALVWSLLAIGAVIVAGPTFRSRPSRPASEAAAGAPALHPSAPTI